MASAASAKTLMMRKRKKHRVAPRVLKASKIAEGRTSRPYLYGQQFLQRGEVGSAFYDRAILHGWRWELNNVLADVFSGDPGCRHKLQCQKLKDRR